MTFAGDNQRIVGTQLAERASERLYIRAIVGTNDECRLERQIDDRAQPFQRAMQVGVVRVGCQAVTHEQEVARGRELRTRDDEPGVVADMKAQVTNQRRRVPPFDSCSHTCQL